VRSARFRLRTLMFAVAVVACVILIFKGAKSRFAFGDEIGVVIIPPQVGWLFIPFAALTAWLHWKATESKITSGRFPTHTDRALAKTAFAQSASSGRTDTILKPCRWDSRHENSSTVR
jgi:hypothetical protein